MWVRLRGQVGMEVGSESDGQSTCGQPCKTFINVLVVDTPMLNRFGAGQDFLEGGGDRLGAVANLQICPVAGTGRRCAGWNWQARTWFNDQNRVCLLGVFLNGSCFRLGSLIAHVAYLGPLPHFVSPYFGKDSPYFGSVLSGVAATGRKVFISRPSRATVSDSGWGTAR